MSGNGTSATITRANGSDLGSFLDEGFQKGMRIRLSGTRHGADGDYVITDLDIAHADGDAGAAAARHDSGRRCRPTARSTA